VAKKRRWQQWAAKAVKCSRTVALTPQTCHNGNAPAYDAVGRTTLILRMWFSFQRSRAPEVLIANRPPEETQGCRQSRMPISPAVVRTRNARGDHRFNRIKPAFPARWVTAYFGLSPVTGFVATVASRIIDATGPVGRDASPKT